MKRLLAAFAVASAVGLVVRAIAPRPSGERVPAAATPAVTSTSSPAPVVPARPARHLSAAPIPGPGPVAGLARDVAARAWQDFRERHDPSLTARFGAGGCLESARGSGREAAPGVDSADAKQAIGRAQELLRELGPLLCVDDASKLGRPLSQATELSAQVSFRQTFQGLDVFPRGSVSFDLGPRGEIFSIQADAVRVDGVANSRTLTSEQARSRVIAALDGLAAGRSDDGNPIVWVNPVDAEGRVLARHAYRYGMSGREVVADAETGEVIRVRDLRTR